MYVDEQVAYLHDAQSCAQQSRLPVMVRSGGS